MKKIIAIVAIFATIFTQNSFAQDSATQLQTAQLLTNYYNIKNALVAGNANKAALDATSFVNAAKAIDYKIIPEESINKLVNDAASISNTKDINKQREYFAGFSTNMAAVAKVVKLTDQPIYNVYCPMKKAYWLSNEKVIKNPYYGSAMLTCGGIKETIQ